MTTPLARLDLGVDRDGRTIASLSGEIDLSNAAEIEQQLLRATQDTNTLTLDLTGLDYLDSRGMAVIQHLADRHTNGDLLLAIIASPDSIAHDVLTITHIAHSLRAPD